MAIEAESRLFIDGKLALATGGRTYPNLNPATEETIGQVADASAADMERAIAAARRAFDETKWSTDLALRSRCLRQLHAALDPPPARPSGRDEGGRAGGRVGRAATAGI